MAALDKIDVAPGVWLRREGAGRSLSVFLAGFVAVLLGLFAVLPLALLLADSDKPATKMLGIALAFFLAAALFAYLTARLAGAGLQITGECVRLRGVLKSHRLPLAEVTGFAPGVFRSFGTYEMGVKIRRATASDLDVWALGVGSAVTDAEQEEVASQLRPLCEGLNRILGEMRQAGPTLPDQR